MDGFLIVDKKQGITSHDVVAKIRKLQGQDKVGHCGTLDPIATGVLVVALGEATKITEYFLGCDKVYEVLAALGSISDTYDACGKVVPFLDKKPEKKRIQDILHVHFTGVISQVPPKYSALKISGKRAYDLARNGVEFSMQPRRVKVDSIKILSYKWPKLKLEIRCGKGTYVRSLVHDLGQKLGCGAYVSELRRTKVAHFDISDSVTLENLALDFENYVLPIRDAVMHLNRIVLRDDEYNLLKDGRLINNVHGVMSEPVFAFYDGQVVGILEFPNNGRLLKFRKKLNIF